MGSDRHPDRAGHRARVRVPPRTPIALAILELADGCLCALSHGNVGTPVRATVLRRDDGDGVTKLLGRGVRQRQGLGPPRFRLDGNGVTHAF
jgi:hypothetical protein